MVERPSGKWSRTPGTPTENGPVSRERITLDDLRTGETFGAALIEAAERIRIEPSEILRTIEEFRECGQGRH